MRYSNRVFLYAPFAALIAFALFAAAHWWADARALAGQLDRANGHEIMPGVKLSFSRKRIGGFPFRLDAVLKNVRLSAGEVTGPVAWTSEDFAMHALTYGRDQWILEAAGRQTLSWRDVSGKEHHFTFLPGTFRASALLGNRELQRFDSEIRDLDGADFRTENAQLHFRRNGGGIDVYFRLENAHAPSGYAAALGPDVKALVASARLDRIGPIEELLRGSVRPMRAFEQWRQTGRVTVTELAIDWNDRRAKISGELTLDPAHNLHGTLTGNELKGAAAWPILLGFRGNRIETSGLSRP